ncbi:hypothetical protein Tco_0600112 [Tanacetum coccineum]|uniref:Uncharacterized protein n=1 Tax=Tanacetum coccineum TaxID=301880 RepID=A0ABQ4WAW3_9ASTR
MIHPQSYQVIHPQSYQVIHPQSYQVIHPQLSQVIHQQASQAPAVSLQSSADPIQVDSSLVAPYFLPTDDPLECLTKALTFMSTILALTYPSSNNQLETSSNPMHQVAMPERHTLSYVGNCSTDIGERIDFGLGAFIVTTNALFQADGVEVYDSDSNDVPNAQPSDRNIIPYSHQVINYTKINLDNKSVNDSLTAELERYKEQVKVLKEGQNVDLKRKDNVSDSCEQSLEIDGLKQTLSEQLKEMESLMQTVTLLKNDFKKEESRNIDREIALEKKIKQLDNIVFKRDQLAQTVHMLMKPQFFYDHTTKQALDPSPSCRPIKVEVPKELPKVSIVNTSLKKLKHHLAGFDVVVKERTTATAMTERSCGFEHIKACFRDEIIPFVKALKDIFNTFDQYLIDELSEVQNVFHQMEQAEKDLVITELKEELRKLKGKSVVACRESLTNNREARVDYIRITKENDDSLLDVVEQARTSNPLDNALAYAYMYTKQIQELLLYVSDKCPSSPSKSEKLVAVTPINKARKTTLQASFLKEKKGVRFNALYLQKKRNLLNRRDLPRDIPLVSVEVLRYEKRSKSENKGKVPTEMELVLEQTQQGSSYEVSVDPHGLKGYLKMEVKVPDSSCPKDS